MILKKTSVHCVCGSGKIYEHCCGRYISGEHFPETAEALMRSRYTAYTQANIDYIQATMREKAIEEFDPVSAEKWAKSAKWKRLTVKRTFSHEHDENCAYVEFVAFYILDGKPEKLAELSEFKRIDNKWYYVGAYI